MTSKKKNRMKVVTGPDTRWSFVNAWEPKAVRPGSKPKYSVCLIIPKWDVLTVEKAKAAIQAAYEEGAAKLKNEDGTIPPLDELQTPLRDGSERCDDRAYDNAYFICASSSTAPGIVDKDYNPITRHSEIYSGVYGRASICMYAFNADNGDRGIACGLNSLQKVRDGDSLGRRSTPQEDFDDQ